MTLGRATYLVQIDRGGMATSLPFDEHRHAFTSWLNAAKEVRQGLAFSAELAVIYEDGTRNRMEYEEAQ